MKTTKTRKLIVLTTLAAAAGLSACASSPSGPASKELLPILESFGLSSGLSPAYVVSNESDATNDSVRVRTVTAKGPDGRVFRLEKLDGAQPLQYDSFINDKITQIQSIYEPNRDPYFSILTKQTTCPERFKPVQETDQRSDGALHLLKLFANDRLTYGACTDDEAAYRVTVGMQRCPGGGLFLAESFVPAKQPPGQADGQGVRSVGCR